MKNLNGEGIFGEQLRKCEFTGAAQGAVLTQEVLGRSAEACSPDDFEDINKAVASLRDRAELME